MKKTLAIALVLVMALSCLSVLFVSAAEVESLTVHFTQLAESSTQDCSLTLFPAGDSDRVIDSGEANLRWATAIAVAADGTIVRVSRNLLSDAQDANNAYEYHSITVPAGGFGVVVHFGDGDNSNGHGDLREYVNELFTAAGIDIPENTVVDVSKAGWQAAGLTTEGGEFDFGSVTFYKGKAPGNGAEEPKEPEIVEVKETIEVDGKLDDTGYTKATWVEKSLFQNSAPIPEDVSGKFTTRYDDDTIYVAVEVKNALAPTLTALYPDKGDDGNAKPATATQIEGYNQKAASGVRVWIRQNNEVRYAFDIQYMGAEKGWIPTRVIYTAEKEVDVTLAQFTENTKYAIVYNEEDKTLTAEIAFKKADFKITGEYSMFVSYFDNFTELVEEGADPYQSLHITNCDPSNDAGLLAGGFAGDTDTVAYEKFDAEATKLGTYTYTVGGDEPEPEDTYEQDIAAKVGEPLEDPDFKINLVSEIKDGVMTVTLTVKDIKEGVHMQALTAKLYYDAERLTLTNEINKDKSVKCDTALPYGDDSTWENLTKVSGDGVIDISFIVADEPDQYIDADHPIVLTFTFAVKEGVNKAGVYVPTESVSSIFAADDGDSSTTSYHGNGAYTVATVEADNSSSSESTPGSTNKPGDAGVLVFAVLGILAIAGAATVVKVRH